jgi:transposase
VVIPLPAVPPLTEELTDRLYAVLPPAAPRGRPRVDARRVLGGILWLMRSGRSWREIPPCFGPWATVASRYRLWQQDGTWTRITAVLTASVTQARHQPYLSL